MGNRSLADLKIIQQFAFIDKKPMRQEGYWEGYSGYNHYLPIA
jgi:hypothetical protein